MQAPRLLLALLLACLARPGRALTLATGTDPYGNSCDTVQWTDAAGKPRQVWLVKGTPGAFITRYTYYAGATLVNATPAGYGMSWPFLVLVNHWHPDSGGAYVTSAGPASDGSSSYTQAVSVSTPFVGAHHLLWRATFRMKADPADASKSFYNDIDYFFQDGRDDFTWSTAYDVSDWAEGALESDNRSPYGDFDWDGNGATNESLSGIGWGTKYKFRSTGSPLSASSAWDYTQANSIPYIWQWKDASLNDREFGVVQNQPYAVQNMGGELHVGSCAGFTAPPSTGSAMPNNGCQAAQQNGYAGWVGQRFTWGSTYKNPGWWIFCGPGNANCDRGPFHNGHGETFNSQLYGAAQNGMPQYPVNAWSMNIHLGAYSAGGVTALVNDTEAAYACTLTASVGSVVLSGPRGPGNFVSAATGSMPNVTYSRPGFDFVRRRWRVGCSAGAAAVSLAVPAAGLQRPTFSFEGLAAAPCRLQLNGVTQAEGSDINSSYDAAAQTWYVTFAKALAAGANAISVSSSCGSPTPTPTATRTPTAGPTSTPAAALTPCGADSLGGFLQAGDKIAFLGDSITYRGNFTKMVQAHLTRRYPGAGFSFINAGGPGDAGLQVWNRLPALLAQNPKVVLLCLGMNDAYAAGSYQTDFPYYMDKIVTALQGAGIRVALLTPGIVDLSLPFNVMPADYNTRLRWEADWVLSYAAGKGLPAFDINAAMSAAQAAMKAALAGSVMIPDTVHPDPAGGWVMGLGALRALGVPDRCGEIRFDAGSASVAASGPLAASGAGSSGFDLVLNTLPPVAPAAARKILPFEPRQAQLNHLTLKASGLGGSSYYVVIDGHRAGPATAAALAAGINLYDYWLAPGSSAGQSHRVDLLDAAGQPASVCDDQVQDELIDDFETPAPGIWMNNQWGGDLWGLDAGTGNSKVWPAPAALATSAPGYDDTGSCLRISGTADLGPGNPPVLLTYLNGLNSDVKDGVRFWVKGLAGKQVRFQIHTWYEKRQSPEYWNDYGYTFTTTGAWQQVSVPFSSLTLPGWGTAYPFNKQEIYNLDWLPFTAGTFDISVDQVVFFCAATGSPTPTRTPSPALSPSPTPTRSASPTPSPSPSPSASATASSTATRTATASPTRTPSPSVTATPTPSASASPTRTASASPTATLSFTAVPPGSSATATPTASPSFSASPTPSLSATASPAATATASPSAAASAQPSGTASPTALPATASATPTRTALPASPSATPSATPLASATLTALPTAPAGSGPTALPTAGEGPVVIRRCGPGSNPNPRDLRVDMQGAAERSELSVYDANLRCVFRSAAGALRPGWNQIPLPLELAQLGNGTYYFRLGAERAGRQAEPAVGRLVILR